MITPLTRRQQEIYEFLLDHLNEFPHPPTLDELCIALGLSSKGSLHKQIQALIDAGLVAPTNNLRRGIHLVEPPTDEQEGLPSSDILPQANPSKRYSSRRWWMFPPLFTARALAMCYK